MPETINQWRVQNETALQYENDSDYYGSPELCSNKTGLVIGLTFSTTFSKAGAIHLTTFRFSLSVSPQ